MLSSVLDREVVKNAVVPKYSFAVGLGHIIGVRIRSISFAVGKRQDIVGDKGAGRARRRPVTSLHYCRNCVKLRAHCCERLLAIFICGSQSNASG